MTTPDEEREPQDREAAARRFTWEPGDIEVVSAPAQASDSVAATEEVAEGATESAEGATEAAEVRQRRIAEARARVNGLSARSDEE